jgi:general secretion pathway protein C
MRDQILKYSWAITLLFLGGAAFLSARLASVLLARQLWVAETTTATTAVQRAEPVSGDRLTDYAVIQTRNLFNANPKPVAQTPPEPTTSVPVAASVAAAPLVPLNVTLVGTAVIETGGSYALIESGNELKLVRENEEVAPGARLLTVKADRILVQRGGATEEILLYPPESAGQPAVAARRPPAVARPQPAPEPASDTVRQVDDSNWLIDSREVEQASANMSQLMTQIRVVPNFTDGQPDGFKVFAIRPGSLFSKIGLQNGDVLKRINGVELQGPEQAFEAYQALKDETSIQIDLVRRNENKTFNYEIR